jgi:hypothetical protein
MRAIMPVVLSLYPDRNPDKYLMLRLLDLPSQVEMIKLLDTGVYVETKTSIT